LRELKNLKLNKKKKNKQILLATSNKGKTKEFQNYFYDSNYNLIPMQKKIKQKYLVDETGNSFEENAEIKSIFYSKKVDLPVIAEDSGLLIKSLDGFPGINSSRIAETDEKRVKIVLNKLKNRKKQERKACFKSVISLAYQGKIIKNFEGKVCGFISKYPRGSNGFGYDPVFFLPDINKTFGEIKVDEKNLYSHRVKAIKKLLSYLKEYKIEYITT